MGVHKRLKRCWLRSCVDARAHIHNRNWGEIVTGKGENGGKRYIQFSDRASAAVKLSLLALIAADSGMFRPVIKDSQQTGQWAVRRVVCPF